MSRITKQQSVPLSIEAEQIVACYVRNACNASYVRNACNASCVRNSRTTRTQPALHAHNKNAQQALISREYVACVPWKREVAITYCMKKCHVKWGHVT